VKKISRLTFLDSHLTKLIRVTPYGSHGAQKCQSIDLDLEQPTQTETE
jgi:hypothetical protein